MLLTNIIVSGSIFRDVIVNNTITVEVEWLECVKDEVPHVLIHVGVEDATIEVVNSPTSVHHLHNQYTVTITSQ